MYLFMRVCVSKVIMLVEWAWFSLDYPYAKLNYTYLYSQFFFVFFLTLLKGQYIII